MRIIADLHIHSPYARAVSRDMTLENLDLWAQKKGILVMGTGDFTHPKRMKEIREKLEPAEEGLYILKSQIPNTKSQTNSKFQNPNSKTRFMVTVEISSIYTKHKKVRRIHNLVFAPSIATAEKIAKELGWRGNLASDGRPITGIDSEELAKIVFTIDPEAALVPAHCLPPFEYIHTQDGAKQIQHVKENDYVYTHYGRLKRVEKVHTRPYKGTTYRIKPWYFRPGLETTAEHPFFAVRTQKHCGWQHGFCRPGCSGKSHCCKKHRAEPQHFIPRWIRAENLEVGDVLVFPRMKEVRDTESFYLSSYTTTLPGIMSDVSSSRGENTQTVTMRGTRSLVFQDRVVVSRDFCRLAGYFVAEGSVNGRDAVSFTFAAHKTEYIGDVKALMTDLFGVTCAKERRKGNSVELIFYSNIVQRVFASLFYGDSQVHRSYTKTLPPWALFLPQEKQVEIFRGWWRGDTGYTVSRELMNQMKVIALRLGIIPSIIRISQESFGRRIHKIGGRAIKTHHDLFQFSGLAFFGDAFRLGEDPIFQKPKFQPRLNRRHGWIDDDFVYLPIRDIDIREFEGTVYNLEVEDDNSYLAEFAAVHNCWTPWFSVFGSMSGFDSLEECFGDLTPQIFAIETGLSSDPAMNWRLSNLDRIALISNSDSHSLQRIGREANVFDCELSYAGIIAAIKSHDPKQFLFTVEFFPEEGKYHYDGHASHKVRMAPGETRAAGGKCPVCGRPVTVGVMHRVEALADRPTGAQPARAIPFRSMVPLDEIIAEAFGQGTGTKKVKAEYERLLNALGTEFSILMEIPLADIHAAAHPAVAEGIRRVRAGELTIEPGYDGEYGTVKIFSDADREAFAGGQKQLFS